MGTAYYGIKNNSNYVITTDGKLLEIGRSRRFNTSVPTPTTPSDDYIWSKIDSMVDAQHCLAIQSNGTLWAWGNNSFGQLGLNDQSNRSTPIQVGSLSVWKQVSCGYTHTVALQSNGTLWAWGSNAFGQLGLSDTTDRSSPVQIGSLLWREITVANVITLAIQSNGTLWGWGNQGYGN